MWDACKVWSATKAKDRESLGDHITAWLRDLDGEVIDTVVRQSSDREFHCISVIIFYKRGRK